MIVEKPKREDWKTLVILLPLLLTMVGVMLYEDMKHPCEDPCEQISTTPVATVPLVEEGDDVSKFGYNGFGVAWDAIEDIGWQGTAFEFPVNESVAMYWDIATVIPLWEDPSSNMILNPTSFRSAVYVTYSGDTPEKAYAYMDITAVSGAGRVSMAIYDDAANLMGKTNWVTLTETGTGWYEFTFDSSFQLVDGETYIIAIGASFNAVLDIFSVADGAPGGTVLPLLKTNSGSEAGLLR